MADIAGYSIVAKSLKRLGVTHVCSVPGGPVLETIAACGEEGIRPIGMRNEQAAVMMAAAQNYSAGKLVCVPILASGPGVSNAATGMLVAKDNCWPLLVPRRAQRPQHPRPRLLPGTRRRPHLPPPRPSGPEVVDRPNPHPRLHRPGRPHCHLRPPRPRLPRPPPRRPPLPDRRGARDPPRTLRRPCPSPPATPNS